MIRPTNSALPCNYRATALSQNSPTEFKGESFMEKSLKQMEEQKEKAEKAILKYGGVSFLFFSTLGLALQSEGLIILSGIIFVFVVLGLIAANSFVDTTTYVSGLQGENNVRAVLREILSSEYSIFYNYPTPHGDIDVLVVGPKGVYALEVKNHNGYITINGDNWERVKVGRGGTVYKAEIGSPSLQAKKNATYIRDLLKKHGIDTWVQAQVVLTNPDVKVKMVKKPENVTVTGLDGLKETVNTGVSTLNSETVEKIKNVLI